MFENQMFSTTHKAPYMDDIIRQQVQYNQLNQQNFYVQQPSLYDEYTKMINSLSQDEQVALMKNSDFNECRLAFEQNFSEYIANKFRSEFVMSKHGNEVMQTLMEKTKTAITSIKNEVQEEREQLRALSKLLQENPNLLSEIQNKIPQQNTESQN